MVSTIDATKMTQTPEPSRLCVYQKSNLMVPSLTKNCNLERYRLAKISWKGKIQIYVALTK
jgi:hypothetical protein